MYSTFLLTTERILLLIAFWFQVVLANIMKSNLWPPLLFLHQQRIPLHATDTNDIVGKPESRKSFRLMPAMTRCNSRFSQFFTVTNFKLTDDGRAGDLSFVQSTVLWSGPVRYYKPVAFWWHRIRGRGKVNRSKFVAAIDRFKFVRLKMSAIWKLTNVSCWHN